MFNPLLFADWRSIARVLTFICWLAVVMLALVIAAHLGHFGNSPHATRDIARFR